MLHDLTTDTREGYGAVVLRLRFCTIFINWTNTVLFKSNLKFDEHIDKTINKVNRIIGLIKRKFKFIDKDLFLTLYKSLIRSHLDYGNLIFYPPTKKYKQVLENAQRRATRLVPELRGLSYRERLIELNLSTLDYRRKRFDIILVFKLYIKLTILT